MKKNYLIAIVLVLITMLSTTVFAANFTDLQKGHWAYEPIMEMANKGILNGYPDGTFLPDKSITRAEFAKILVLALDLETNGKTIEFQDVSSNDWSYKYIQAAAKYLSAYRDDRNNLMYMPDAKAVREDVAVAIVIASGHENDKYSLKTLNKFSDKDQISTNLRKYVAIAVENGLMSGHSNGTFEPRGYLTRAQVSKLMKNIEDLNDKVVIKDTNNSSTITEDYFDDIVFDTKTLKLDLGENWDKYQYCKTSNTRIIYVPAQRYLNYNESAKGKDKATGYSLSNMYGMFDGKEKITLKIMLKENTKKYTTIQLRDPFYVAKAANKVYTNSSTGERYIEQVVEATNKLDKVEYQINNEGWVDATDSINNKRVDIIVNVEKYDNGKDNRFNIVMTDEYGNKRQIPYYFTLEKEYFTDISFDSKTLKLDLGEDWDKYQYCSGLSARTTIYVPAQRYLQYQITSSQSLGRDSQTNYSLSNVYGFFGTSEKATFKIMLKDNPKKYTTIQLRDPFYVSKSVRKAYTKPNDGERYIEVVVSATNKLVNAEYRIDKGDWIVATNVINGKIADFEINVEKYDDGKNHTFSVRLTDEYGNVGQKLDDFRFSKAYFSDISFSGKTLQLDLGENWDKYILNKASEPNGVMYVPSQRKLTYKQNTVKGSDETNKYLKTNSYEGFLERTKREVAVKVILKEDTSRFIVIIITNPFFISKEPTTVYTEASTGRKYVEAAIETTGELSKVEYQIDGGVWFADDTYIGQREANLIIYVDGYDDGASHNVRIRLTDKNNNSWTGRTTRFRA